MLFVNVFLKHFYLIYQALLALCSSSTLLYYHSFFVSSTIFKNFIYLTFLSLSNNN
ncbi:hypothetical protein RU93_GL000857 [Enterococcus aquimarinus]|uniref:Uncharacterized protein n=1 Tax=Enterococcus aquimarinus TaxID=328396 RepID=A0A1L8QP25_9ENTE|nr:hypothetical protein RU93_GL000857 [Enterococcus aquimarinus]